jgi:hypothetical protein
MQLDTLDMLYINDFERAWIRLEPLSCMNSRCSMEGKRSRRSHSGPELRSIHTMELGDKESNIYTYMTESNKTAGCNRTELILTEFIHRIE